MKLLAKQIISNFLSRFLYNFLHSFSQIMLQRNVVTGFLFAVGIGINSPIILLGAALAVLSALVTAQLFQYNACSINTGLYGFNAALIGIAVFFFLPVNLFSFILVIIVAAISTVIMHFMLCFISPNFPVYTTPFIISTWLLLVFINMIGIDLIAVPLDENSGGDFYAVMRGIGQVMLQGYWLSGIIFIAGLLLHSFKVAAWTVIGSLAGMIIARTFSFSEDLVMTGLYGFNAILTAIALAQRFTKNTFNNIWPIFLGIVISVLLTRVFEYLLIPALTAPFVLSSWLIIGLVKINANEVPKCQCPHKPEVS